MDVINYSKIKKVQQDLETHKSAYTSNKERTDLKIATVDKELNDFQKTLSQVNINQEAKQSVTGYGVISLPKNAANGQVSSIGIKGRTLKQELNYNRDTWVEWTKNINASVVNNKLVIDYTSSGYTTLPWAIKPNTKYGFIIIVSNNTLTAGLRMGSALTGSVTSGFVAPDEVGVIKRIYTSQATPGNTFPLGTGSVSGSATIDNIRVFELPTGSEIETDFNTMTADQLAQKYPYIKGDSAKSTISAGRITAKNEDETEQSQLYYVAKDPETGEIIEARSLPNGTKDEVRVSEGKLIKRVSDDVVLDGSFDWTIQSTGTNNQMAYIPNIPIINFSAFTTGKNNKTRILQNNAELSEVAYNDRDLIESRGKYYITNTPTIAFIFEPNKFANINDAKAYFNANPVKLTYQLAEPIITPIETSGTLLSYPSGTIWIENVIADAGIYTDKFTILQQDLPIKEIEKISKVDFTTGIETELDVSQAVISTDKLSFTHPDLVNGDIVFTTYFYDKEGTLGETTVTYYDSRHTVKDKTLENKFYQWTIEVDNGTPSIKLVEV